MNTNSILYPVYVMIALTAFVMVLMAVQRTRALLPQKLPLSQINTRDGLGRALGGNDNAGNNYMNLFELPVLFYALAAFALATGQVTALLVKLCWAFAGLRVLHTLVHVTSNRLEFRAPIWLLSAGVLFAAWVVFARTGL